MRALVYKPMVIALAMLLIAAATASGAEPRSTEFPPEAVEKMQKVRAVIHTTFGDMTIKFFPNVAPNHVNNFIELAKKGFYDGTLSMGLDQRLFFPSPGLLHPVILHDVPAERGLNLETVL